MTNLEKSQQILLKPFDVKTHKKYFINYLEICITEDGVIHYSIPSHNGFLEYLLAKQRNIKCSVWEVSQVIGELCPREYWCDYNNWLCKETKAIQVWGEPTNKVVGTPNELQLKALNLLVEEGLLNKNAVKESE